VPDATWNRHSRKQSNGEEGIQMTNDANIKTKIAAVADALIKRGVASKENIQGCDAIQIAEIETDCGCELPVAYREFLARMGRRAGDFYVGTDMFYPVLLGLTKEAHDLVAEDNSDISLPQDAIVFSMHQGYQFLFFRAQDGDDPPVYYYMEQSGTFVKKDDSLSKFLFNAAHDSW